MTSPALLSAIEAVYAAIDAPKPRIIEGCPCCIDTRKVDILLAKPRRELTGDDLYRYAAGVFLTVGSVADYRYLLPRILELAVLAPGDVPQTEILLSGLERGGWLTWAAKEQRALQALLDAWFDQALIDCSDPETYADSVDSLLCGFARAGLDISPYLQRLAGPEYRVQLERWRASSVDFDTGLLLREPFAFWEDVPEAWARAWLLLAGDAGARH